MCTTNDSWVICQVKNPPPQFNFSPTFSRKHGVDAHGYRTASARDYRPGGHTKLRLHYFVNHETDSFHPRIYFAENLQRKFTFSHFISSIKHNNTLIKKCAAITFMSKTCQARQNSVEELARTNTDRRRIYTGRPMLSYFTWRIFIVNSLFEVSEALKSLSCKCSQ